MEFTERAGLEEGFTPIFQAEVRPKLITLEESRKESLGFAIKWMAVTISVTIAIIALVFLIFGFGDGTIFPAIFIGFVGGIGAYGLWYFQSVNWGESVADAIMPSICRHVGDLSYNKHGDGYFPVDKMNSIGVVGHHNRSSLSDRLEGTYRDTKFTMVEAHLQNKTRGSNNKDKTTTVFRGLLFSIGVPMEIPAPILITRDRGGIGNAFGEMFAGSSGRGMPKVSFDHAEFEKAFEVYSDDPKAAHRLMPPAFLDSLLTIGAEETGNRGTKGMVAGFLAESFYLALARKGDFLKMGSLTTPVAEMEADLHDIFDDITLIHRIIDRLHGD